MRSSLALSLMLVACHSSTTRPDVKPQRPNVILMMTDDQGWGDLGVHGNQVLRTPSLDRMAQASVRLDPFYVCPVCAPTRAALMTGRYTQRTHAIDTYIGRAMLEPEEVTLAERLSEAGYATGIFGKWHLGDCAPMRPMDQGFERSLVHRGGGIGQPSDPEGGERRYTDPRLIDEGVERDFEGYCTDIVTDLASVLQGGMGMAVGANVGDHHGMFEPIHGSAPKHAGKNVASPVAMIMAVSMMLDHLGEGPAARAIEASIRSLLEDSRLIGVGTGDHPTDEVGQMVCDELRLTAAKV